MPFVQMENISHFLRACQMPPLSLPPHDVFQTVDLYEAKDPAQVLQCIGAFSRKAHTIQPTKFPRAIGGKGRGATMSPQLSGSSQGGYAPPTNTSALRGRGASSVSDTPTTFNPLAKASYSGRTSPVKDGPASPGPVSSWSKAGDEGSTAPAWNIHQYGYMGGASQGNQGIAFGARRQITSAAPHVPNMAEKERKRKEEAAEADRLRLQAEEAENKRRIEREAEEERAAAEEERRWEEETRRQREIERRAAEEEKRRWDEEQRRWKEEEDVRLNEEKETVTRLEKEVARKRADSDARLNGQFLSQYQADQGRKSRNVSGHQPSHTPESQRVKELERELEQAKERERQYEQERQERAQHERARSHQTLASHDMGARLEQETKNRDRSRSRSRPRQPAKLSRDEAAMRDERDLLRNEWQHHHNEPPFPIQHNDQHHHHHQQQAPPLKPPRPLPEPQAANPAPPPPPVQVKKNNTGPSSRPLPNPSAYTNNPTTTSTTPANRTDRYLTSNPAPQPSLPTSHRPTDYSTTTEVDAENQRRTASQTKTKAGGWASKSLLEREMERERERQREWEDGQKVTAAAARDGKEGAGPGQSWNVNEYGYLGGDSQNRGGPGLGVGGARRQIIGPRPPP